MDYHKALKWYNVIMKEVLCTVCPQSGECAMKGRPLIPGGSYKATPPDCRYFVCPDGVIAARKALRRNPDSEDLVAFGTIHKPFKPGRGRWVAGEGAAEKGYEYGSVYAKNPWTDEIVVVKRSVHNRRRRGDVSYDLG